MGFSVYLCVLLWSCCVPEIHLFQCFLEAPLLVRLFNAFFIGAPYGILVDYLFVAISAMSLCWGHFQNHRSFSNRVGTLCRSSLHFLQYPLTVPMIGFRQAILPHWCFFEVIVDSWRFRGLHHAFAVPILALYYDTPRQCTTCYCICLSLASYVCCRTCNVVLLSSCFIRSFLLTFVTYSWDGLINVINLSRWGWVGLINV